MLFDTPTNPRSPDLGRNPKMIFYSYRLHMLCAKDEYASCHNGCIRWRCMGGRIRLWDTHCCKQNLRLARYSKLSWKVYGSCEASRSEYFVLVHVILFARWPIAAIFFFIASATSLALSLTARIKVFIVLFLIVILQMTGFLCCFF